ncbi:quinoprotein glucose dehydrogenase/quinate dehydrogenase (quinone) [Sphingobium sp. AP50]|uniref:membrane-bound PQQ-dependent dehydrogenase, glucose/quinate/shikimate family n=1 Tax=Sphingobium sp. AP50 TaxID=1884369 RepID=UPI0008D0AEA2|nr:membrane-bound PQQ-dependent dehydrogenase, glucose/quinate/shikimate family [Sphingobium sp. AP50]SEJ95569.1 quinoprotein glucose dehydrogenase/quinate dehydrogenase (quinone) [Sphingobium sp. AP50]
MPDRETRLVNPAGVAAVRERRESLALRAIIFLYAIVLMLVGGALLLGGARLIWLGGSFYYALAGGATLAAGGLIAMRRKGGVRLYALMLLVTLAWAVAEAGSNGWALAPRIIPPVVLGLPLIFWGKAGQNVARGADVRHRTRRARLTAIAAAVTAVAFGAVVHVLFVPSPIDPAFQAGVGTADEARPAGGGMADADWAYYGGDAGAHRSSALNQITPANVDKLKVAWTYRVGPTPAGLGKPSALEMTPLKIGNMLYACTGYSDVIALDAESGKEQWRFRSGADIREVPVAACRGLAFARVNDQHCPERILTNTVDARLIALDARTGRKCASFGKAGEVSLLEGMGAVRPGYYYQTSAPTAVAGNVVLGGWVFDNQFWGEPSGVIRAYDIKTGKLSWAWDMGRPDRKGAPAGGESYTPSTPNSWAPMAADEALGLVYVPLGGAPPDHFGGRRRPFDEKYGSSIVALDARTGTVRWSFQTVHHDLWDYDVLSPSLVDIPRGSSSVQALVQATKRGQLFLLDRRTGKPLSTVVERQVPQGGIVEGERLSPSQPYSTDLPVFSGPPLTERDMWGVTALDQLWCRIRFKEARFEGEFTPPGVSPFIIYPGYMGGSNWGGVSIDPRRNVAIVGSLRLATYARLIPDAERQRAGIRPTIWSKIGTSTGGHPSLAAQQGTPVGVELNPFLSPLGIPCQQPPYGVLSAVNLRTGKLVWTQPIGSAEESGPMGFRSHLSLRVGTPLQGGSLTTATGLTFIGASQDAYFRAFETASGKLLWETKLPAGGHASPATYLTRSGRQMVVIAAGGSLPLRSRMGDYIVAYSLGDKDR